MPRCDRDVSSSSPRSRTAALVVLLGGVLREPSRDAGRAAAPLDAARPPTRRRRLRGRATRAGTRRAARAALRAPSRRIAARSASSGSPTSSGRARPATPSYYSLAGARAAQRARSSTPRDPIALSGLGSLALRAPRVSRGARARPARASRSRRRPRATYGVVGDALVELGRYDEAFATFDRMVALQADASPPTRASPTPASCSAGRAGAIEAMELALGRRRRPRRADRLDARRARQAPLRPRASRAAAARQYRAALAAFPGYASALDGLARVEAATRPAARARSRSQRRAVDAVPLPQYVAQLGDLLDAAGDASARRASSTRWSARSSGSWRANGVSTDLETALFDVDHGIRLPSARRWRARARAERPSIEGDDVLAWALARDGRCDEALRVLASARSGSARATRSSSSTAG